jgi:hypothetical protein
MASNPNYPNTLSCVATRLQNSDGTSFVQLVAGDTDGTKIESIAVTSDDSSDRVLQLCVSVGAVDYPIGEITIPDGAGTNGIDKAVNLLNTTDLPWLRSDGVNQYLYLVNGMTLKAKSKTAITAARFINVFVQCANY